MSTETTMAKADERINNDNCCKMDTSHARLAREAAFERAWRKRLPVEERPVG